MSDSYTLIPRTPMRKGEMMDNRGFTMIELLVVIGIVVILAAISTEWLYESHARTRAIAQALEINRVFGDARAYSLVQNEAKVLHISAAGIVDGLHIETFDSRFALTKPAMPGTITMDAGAFAMAWDWPGNADGAEAKVGAGDIVLSGPRHLVSVDLRVNGTAEAHVVAK